MPAWELVQSLWLSERDGLARFGWVQNSYSLLEREPERELFPALARARARLHAVLAARGRLADRASTAAAPAAPAGSRMTLRPEPYAHLVVDETFDALEALRARGERARRQHGRRSRSRWLLHHPRVTAVIVGPRRPEQLEPAREALELELTPTRARRARQRCSIAYPVR